MGWISSSQVSCSYRDGGLARMTRFPAWISRPTAQWRASPDASSDRRGRHGASVADDHVRNRQRSPRGWLPPVQTRWPHWTVDLSPVSAGRVSRPPFLPVRQPGCLSAWIAKLQIQECTQDAAHGGQLIGGDGAKTAIKSLICYRPRVFGPGERGELAQARRLRS